MDFENILSYYKICECLPVGPSPAPVCCTSRNDLCVCACVCVCYTLQPFSAHTFVHRQVGLLWLSWHCLGSTALTACVLPTCPQLFSKFIASAHVPFPFTLDLLHEFRTFSVSEIVWEYEICCAQSMQHMHKYFWLGIMDESVQTQSGSPLPARVSCNSGSCLPHCLKPFPLSFRFSSKFSVFGFAFRN